MKLLLKTALAVIVLCVSNVSAADAPPSKGDPTPAPPVRTMEVKLPKNSWESSHANAMKVGDWIEVEMTLVQGTKMRQECIEVGDHYTVMLVRSSIGGRQMEQKIKSLYTEANPDEEEAAKLRKEQNIEIKDIDDKVKVKDKEVSAKRHEVYQNGKLTSRTWISAEIPMGGQVKTEGADGKIVTQITDYGVGK